MCRIYFSIEETNRLNKKKVKFLLFSPNLREHPDRLFDLYIQKEAREF